MNEIITDENASLRQLLDRVVRLSIPAILAEITSIIMQYIDAAMVGSLGKEATASIGLVSTSTWLVGGLCISSSIGFSVQAAQLIGAKKEEEARSVFRQSIIISLLIGLSLSVIAVLLSGPLPRWLGGEENILGDASAYFMIFAFALPFEQLRMLSGQMLQCSGNMKIPSMLNMILCLLDVIFNFFLIFPERTLEIPFVELSLTIPGAGLEVIGAALGTALSEVYISLTMTAYACLRSEKLAFRYGGKWKLQKKCLANAFRIAFPAALEHTATCGAYVAATKIIAPLGNTAVAANSLAVTAESFCYMPGYGVGTAATTLVGQSIGANKKELAKKYAKLTVILGISAMSAAAVIMYLIAPFMFAILTDSAEVSELGIKVLRIEAFAEPLYAASIVCSGVLRGAGDTLVPSIINLISMWCVRIVLSVIFISLGLGLTGIWIAMCIELCFRGTLFIIRTVRGNWLEKKFI